MSRQKIECLFSGLIMIFLIWVVWEPRSWPAPARIFPWSLGFLVLALALIQLVVAGRAVLAEKHRAANENERISLAQEPTRRSVIAISVWIVGFFLGIWLLGFKIGSFFLTLGFMKTTAKENWTTSVAMAVGTYLFFWLVFDLALKVPLGDGLLADYFELN